MAAAFYIEMADLRVRSIGHYDTTDWGLFEVIDKSDVCRALKAEERVDIQMTILAFIESAFDKEEREKGEDSKMNRSMLDLFGRMLGPIRELM